MNDHPNKRRPSVFVLAAASKSITAEIDVDDLLALRRDWTREEASLFLAQHAGHVGTAMIQAGMATLILLAERGADDAH